MPFTRYVPIWTGFNGAPGFTVLNFVGAKDASGATGIAGTVKNMFDALATRLPTDVTINYPGEATIHADDGTLTGAVPVVAPAATEATGLGPYAAPVGVRFTWETGTIVSGRRVRGRTFIVPVINSQFDTDGSIAPTPLAAFVTAAQGFIAGLALGDHQLAVWSQTTSTVSPVTAATVPDQATVLRSRRD